MNNSKVKKIKIIKKISLFVLVVVVFLWAFFFLLGHYKIYSAKKNYFKNYVKLGNYDFKKYKQNATISMAVENLGKRLLDSIVIKINYYDSKGKLLGSDVSDVLKMVNDVLYPGKAKVFRIEVTCPEDTADIKLSIK